MKKISIFTGVLFILFFYTGCNEIDEWTQFDIEYNKSVTIFATTGINIPIDIPTPPISTNSSSEFEINNTTKKLVEKINLKTLELTITSPSDSDFSFLRSIEVYLSAEGLPETKVAWKEDISNDTGRTIKLETSREKLKEYIFKDEIRQILGKDHQVDVHSVFFVDAGS